MRIIKLILFIVILAFLCSVGYGQVPTAVNFGGTRPIDTAWAARHLRIDSTVRFRKYATSNSSQFLRVNSSGFLENAVPSGGGGSADSTIFATNYRVDTGKANIRNAKQNNITLTTTGTSGAATLVGATLNIPVYAGQTYTAGGWLGLSGSTFYFDTASRLAYNLNSPSGLQVPTTSAVNSALSSYVTGTRLADSTAAIRAAFPSTSGLIPYSDTSTIISSVKRLKDTASAIRGDVVPYTGAILDVNLGTHNILPNSIQFNTSPTGTLTSVGTLYWDATNVTLSMPLTADVNMQIGQELYTRARNNTGSIIANGTVVYINSAQGNNPTIAKADADSVTTAQVIGVATEDIPINGTGFITVTGVVNGVNTSGYSSGDALYLDTVAGQITTSILPSPHNVVFVGYALNSTNNGRIFVRPSSPISSDSTMTVNGSQVAPTQSAVNKYVTTTVSGYVPTSRTITINGTSQDLSANRTYSVGTVTSVSAGYGTNFTTITSTGSVVVDTVAMATRARVQKGVDSVAGLPRVTSAAIANAFALTFTGSPITGTGTFTPTVDTSTAGLATMARVKKQIDSVAALAGGITALTGDVTASGSGTVTATLAAATVYTITETTSFTYNGNNSDIQVITMANANDTVTLTNITEGRKIPYEFIVKRSTASANLYWNTTVKLPYGAGSTQPYPQSTSTSCIDFYYIYKREGVIYVKYELCDN